MAIGGQGVSLGYWRQPELTAERFVADPFRGGATDRLYLTGDLGYWRHDGTLQHLGRIDGQIKLRGHRIELGEIEVVLARHADVAQAVVVACEWAPGDVRLVAHVQPRGVMPDAALLRAHLRAQLPDYMVPQCYLRMDAPPLLPNGKVNRKALPRPDSAAWLQAAGAAERPIRLADMSPCEQVVAAIWSALLGGVQPELDDNFFDLGGHSLLAAQAAEEIARQLGVKVSVRQFIFETLRQMAAGCERDGARLPAGEAAATR